MNNNDYKNEINRQKNKIDSLFKLADKIEDLEIQSHLSKYLCVLVSGYLENSMKIFINYYTDAHADKNISKYVGKQIANISNLKEERLKQLIGAFNKEWYELFKNEITNNEELKTALDNVVDIRNQISHGGNVSISLVRIKDYYTRILKIIEKLQHLFFPDN